MKITLTPRLNRIVADSLPEVCRYLNATPRVSGADSGSETIRASTSWDLEAGWDATLDMCRTGWSKGGQDMRLVLKQLGKVSVPMTEQRHNMEAGNFVMDRYLTGNPECFKAKVKSRQSVKPTIRFAVNISSNGGTTGQALANCGAAIAQAVKQLEARGNKVEVTAYDATLMSGRGRIVTGWNVKRADGKLDMAALAFSIAHPAAMRRIGFALIERVPFGNTGSYGSATELLITDLEHSDSILFNACLDANHSCGTPEQAVATIQRILDRGR